jgi:radical SAM-linked protein
MSLERLMQNKRFKLTVKLSKYSDMVYFSQLDMLKVLERALRRSGLPLYYTQGYTPRVKISFIDSLKVGQQGSLSVVLNFSEELEPDRVKKEISLQLPPGLEIQNIDYFKK